MMGLLEQCSLDLVLVRAKFVFALKATTRFLGRAIKASKKGAWR